MKSQILIMDPLPNINHELSLVLQHERQSAVQFIEKIEMGRAQQKARKAFGKEGNLQESQEKSAHTVVSLGKHGFPPGDKFKNTTAGNVIGENAKYSDEVHPEMKESNTGWAL